MKRGRNQRRRQGMNINRALDSNGPDVRIRGTANQIYDKYLALARDASSAGDRVKGENYLQHAEHYFRLMRAMQPSLPVSSEHLDAEGDQPSIGESGSRGQRDEETEAEPGDAMSNGGPDNGDRRNENDPEGRRMRRRRPRRHAGDGEGERDEAAADAAVS